MDERYLEQAGALTDALNNSGVNQAAKKAFSDTDLAPHEYKRLDCSECEEDLPLFRLKKGMTLCVLCQTAQEKSRKYG